jgi:hypothetical protein
MIESAHQTLATIAHAAHIGIHRETQLMQTCDQRLFGPVVLGIARVQSDAVGGGQVFGAGAGAVNHHIIQNTATANRSECERLQQQNSVTKEKAGNETNKHNSTPTAAPDQAWVCWGWVCRA